MEIVSLSHTNQGLIAPEKTQVIRIGQFFVGLLQKGDKPDGQLKHAERYRMNVDEGRQGYILQLILKVLISAFELTAKRSKSTLEPSAQAFASWAVLGNSAAWVC